VPFELSHLASRAQASAERIAPYVRRTELARSPAFSELSSAQVFCKLENLQVTGSFKARGAFNKVLALSHQERARGVVAASTGNHGAAVAHALVTLGVNGVIFVPEGSSQAKLENIRRHGGEVRFAGLESGATERAARAYALDGGFAYVSPYNDWDVVAGQATIGVELAEQLPGIDVLVASLGGGGLVGGIGAYLKAIKPSLRVVAASPRNSQAMIASLQAGRIVEVEHLPTLSDGTAGGLDDDALTFELCRGVVDECIAVSEDEIRAAMRLFIEAEHMLLEGAAGVALAALSRLKLADACVAVIICGANIAANTLKSAL
jgi:threonine dehydratase